MSTRLNAIKAMTAEQVAVKIYEHDITDDFCKGDCREADSEKMDPKKESCIACCVKWLNEVTP